MMNLKKPALSVATAGLLSVGAWAGLATTAQAAAPPSPAVAISPAADGLWPAQVNGTPTHLAPGAALGYYVWHDNNGWHIEATHPTHTHLIFSGWVSTDGTLAVQRVDDEHNDLTSIDAHHHVLSFAFNNYGYLDGVHFETHGAQHLDFHLFVDGAPIGPAQVYIGHSDLHPTHVPFDVSRTAID